MADNNRRPRGGANDRGQNGRVNGGTGRNERRRSTPSSRSSRLRSGESQPLRGTGRSAERRERELRSTSGIDRGRRTARLDRGRSRNVSTNRAGVSRRVAGKRSSRVAVQRGSVGREINPRLVLAIASVIVLIVVVVFGVKVMTNKISSQTQVTDPAAAFTPVACSTDTLTTSFSQSGTIAGGQVKFSLGLKNPDKKRPCVMETGRDNVHVVVTSGGHTVFDSRACKVGVDKKRLLLDAGMSTKVSITWNGVASGSDCAGTAVAQPGTYVAQAFIGDKPISEKGQTFALISGYSRSGDTGGQTSSGHKPTGASSGDQITQPTEGSAPPAGQKSTEG
ncbi:hypothetical protein [Arcanobacterium canis]